VRETLKLGHCYTIIEVIQQEGLLDHVSRLGDYFLGQLRRLQERFASIVDVRGIGLMIAIEIDSRERRDRIIQNAFQRGLLLLGCGYKAIRFLPPLCSPEGNRYGLGNSAESL